MYGLWEVINTRDPELMKKLTEYLNKSDPTRPRLISTAWIEVGKEENADNIYEDSKVKMLGPYDMSLLYTGTSIQLTAELTVSILKQVRDHRFRLLKA